MAERESSGSLHSPGRNQENSSTTTSAREPTRAREQQRRTAAQGERATGLCCLTQLTRVDLWHRTTANRSKCRARLPPEFVL
eukprot:767122-Hanusia_phi.AAC.3